jgi:Cu/Ag efflux protein CusF
MTSNMKRAGRRMILLASLVAGAASVAMAHHSASAFDATKQTTITGTIKKFDWSNPHTWAWIDVTNEQGVVETWGVEGMSPNYLARRGWSRTTLKPGDKITVTLRPMKDGEKGGMWVTAKRPTGEILLMGGAITDP